MQSNRIKSWLQRFKWQVISLALILPFAPFTVRLAHAAEECKNASAEQEDLCEAYNTAESSNQLLVENSEELTTYALGSCKPAAEVLEEHLTGCWPCTLFGKLFDAINLLSTAVYTYIQDPTITLMALFLAFWLALRIGKMFVTYPPPDVMDFWNKTGQVLFRAIFATALLIQPAGVISYWLISPLIEFAADFNQQVLKSYSGVTAFEEIPETTSTTADGSSSKTKLTMVDIIKRETDAALGLTGEEVTPESIKKEADSILGLGDTGITEGTSDLMPIYDDLGVLKGHYTTTTYLLYSPEGKKVGKQITRETTIYGTGGKADTTTSETTQIAFTDELGVQESLTGAKTSKELASGTDDTGTGTGTGTETGTGTGAGDDPTDILAGKSGIDRINALMTCAIPEMTEAEAAEENQMLNSQTRRALYCLVESMTKEVSYGMAMGSCIMCNAWGANVFLGIRFLSPGMLIAGIMIWGTCFLLVLVFSFKLLDATMRIGIIATILPLLIVSWVFPQTTGYAKKGFNIMVNVVLTYIILAIVMAFAIILLLLAFQGQGSENIREMFLTNNIFGINEILEFPSLGFLFAFVCCLLAVFIVNMVDKTATEYSEVEFGASAGSAVGAMASKMVAFAGKTAVSTMRIGATKVNEFRQNQGWTADNFIATNTPTSSTSSGGGSGGSGGSTPPPAPSLAIKDLTTTAPAGYKADKTDAMATKMAGDKGLQKEAGDALKDATDARNLDLTYAAHQKQYDRAVKTGNKAWADQAEKNMEKTKAKQEKIFTSNPNAKMLYDNASLHKQVAEAHYMSQVASSRAEFSAAPDTAGKENVISDIRATENNFSGSKADRDFKRWGI